MQIINGVARGLEYLHDRLNPAIIYRDLKCSNLLLDQGYHVKLSDFGIAIEGPRGDQAFVKTRPLGSLGYCAPEHRDSGHLTVKADIYSFGIVLLELITGRKAYDETKPPSQRMLIHWVCQYVNTLHL